MIEDLYFFLGSLFPNSLIYIFHIIPSSSPMTVLFCEIYPLSQFHICLGCGAGWSVRLYCAGLQLRRAQSSGKKLRLYWLHCSCIFAKSSSILPAITGWPLFVTARRALLFWACKCKCVINTVENAWRDKFHSSCQLTWDIKAIKNEHIFCNSTLSAVKSNVFFEKFKVKSNGKKSEVQRVLDFTFFTVGLHFLLKWSPTVKKVKSNGCWTSLFFKVKSNTCAPFPR